VVEIEGQLLLQTFSIKDTLHCDQTVYARAKSWEWSCCVVRIGKRIQVVEIPLVDNVEDVVDV
jgi:hypothetical protein